jgi:hypothetical protein
MPPINPLGRRSLKTQDSNRRIASTGAPDSRPNGFCINCTFGQTRAGNLRIEGRGRVSTLHLEQLGFGNHMEGKPVPCGDGYYVLGDELKDSDDSRFNGPVPARRVMGRAWLIVWPWKRLGWVR